MPTRGDPVRADVKRSEDVTGLMNPAFSLFNLVNGRFLKSTSCQEEIESYQPRVSEVIDRHLASSSASR